MCLKDLTDGPKGKELREKTFFREHPHFSGNFVSQEIERAANDLQTFAAEDMQAAGQKNEKGKKDHPHRGDGLQRAACARAILLHRAQGLGGDVDVGVRGADIFQGIQNQLVVPGNLQAVVGDKGGGSEEHQLGIRPLRQNGQNKWAAGIAILEKPLMMDLVWLLSGVVMRGLRATSSCSSSSETELASLKTTGSLFFMSFWVIMCFCAVTAKFVARRPL